MFDPAFTFTNVLTGVVLTEFTRVTRKPEGATKKRPGSSQRAGRSPPSAAIASLQTGARAAARTCGGEPLDPIVVRDREAAAEVDEFEREAEVPLELLHEGEHLPRRRDVSVGLRDLRADVAVNARDRDRGELLGPRVGRAREAALEMEAELRLGDARVDVMERSGIHAGIDAKRDADALSRRRRRGRRLLELVARVDVQDGPDLDRLRDLLRPLRGAREENLVASPARAERRHDLAERNDLGRRALGAQHREKGAVPVGLESVMDAELREAGRERRAEGTELRNDRRAVVDVERGSELGRET